MCYHYLKRFENLCYRLFKSPMNDDPGKMKHFSNPELRQTVKEFNNAMIFREIQEVFR